MGGYSLLEGVRVVEVSQLAPSSTGGHLADLGAEVIKVEDPRSGDGIRYAGALAVGTGEGPGFMHLRWNRGKKSIALDLRTDAGKAAFLDLVAQSDVVVEGTRAGYLERLGLGFEVLKDVKPSIVYCCVSGTGTDGPYRDLATGGLWFDAYAGLRSVDGDHPSPPGAMGGSAELPIAMYAVGAYAAMGILAGLHRARTTGASTRMEISSVDVATAWYPDRIDAALNAECLVPRPGWTPDGRLAHWPRVDAYATKDGAIVLQAHLDKFWHRLCSAVERPDLARVDLETVDETHGERARRVWQELCELFRQRTTREWVDLFLAHDIAGGPVNTVKELLDDPHFVARGPRYVSEGPDGLRLTLAASPVQVPEQEFQPLPAPSLGQDGEDVLRDVAGYDRHQITAALQKKANPPGGAE